MNREQQIEEMAGDLENTILGLGIHLCEKSAEKLYDLGYRKVSDNYIGTDKVLRSIDYRPVDEVRKETAREILNELIDSSNKITFFDCRMALGLDKLAKQFGLEIKE